MRQNALTLLTSVSAKKAACDLIAIALLGFADVVSGKEARAAAAEIKGA